MFSSEGNVSHLDANHLLLQCPSSLLSGIGFRKVSAEQLRPLSSSLNLGFRCYGYSPCMPYDSETCGFEVAKGSSGVSVMDMVVHFEHGFVNVALKLDKSKGHTYI